MSQLLDFIGNTPLVEIKRLSPNPAVRILAKLEYMNPGGSIKDRAAAYMIEAGERSGELTPDKTVIEATSGNTGIGLAMVCAIKGYRLLLTMSENASEERKKILRARGAEILLTPGHLGTDGAIEETYRLARENPEQYFMTDQFNNEANWQAHYYGTAEEIWNQTDQAVNTVVVTLGTSGTAMGISRRMKELNPGVRIVGVEPYLGHKIQGLKNMKEAYRPEIFDRKLLDVKPNVDDEAAFAMTRRLAKEEGLFVGMSSGAAMEIARAEAAAMSEGTLVVIFPDSGERYLSTTLFAQRDKIDLQLYNTATRKKERFEPLAEGRVSMYSCGPTAHMSMDLGQCRRMIFADLLSRYLRFRGYDVTHIVNITDFDDKTIAGAAAAGQSLADFTAEHIAQIEKDLAELRVAPADKYPVTSQEFPEMVALAETLVKRGTAYEKLRSVYFDISSVDDYGALSNVDTDKIRLGATVDLDEYEKDNPRDFTLLKRARLNELKKGMYVKTTWGNVRPSLHLQCAAISRKYLGDCYDIHTGGSSLIFPHHENEIAIARAATGHSPARYWLHCAGVLAPDSDSHWRSTVITYDDVRKMGFSGRQIRYWLISAHYRKTLSFTKDGLATAERALQRLDNCLKSLMAVAENPAAIPAEGGDKTIAAEIDQLLYDIKQGLIDALDEDLNVSAALASIFKNVRAVNSFLSSSRLDAGNARRILDAFKNINSVFHIFDFEETGKVSSPTARDLMRQRDRARKNKDWARADQLRDQLREMGVQVVDYKI